MPRIVSPYDLTLEQTGACPSFLAMARLVPHILDASGDLEALLVPLLDGLARAEAAAKAVVEIPPTDVVIRVWPQAAIAADGVGGFCPRRREIEVALDPDNPALSLGPGSAYERTIIHELHHVLRRDRAGYGETLGEALVSEGLAGHFVVQTLGTAPEPWEQAVAQDELRHWARRAMLDWRSRNYDHSDWFFGHGEKPLWLGYALGFAVVADYLDAHRISGTGALADKPVSYFVPHLAAIARGARRAAAE